MSSSSISLNFPAFIQSEQQKKSRLVAGLLLTVVVLLHTILIYYLLHAPKTEQKNTPVVVEVMMLPAPGPMQKQAAKEPPPAPPQKKEPIKPKPVVKPPKPVKKRVVVKKPALKPEPPRPEQIKEVVPVPEFEPAPPVVAPVPAAAPSASSNTSITATPEKTTQQGQSKTVVSGVVPLLRVPPKYPARAARRQIEGWVKVEFTIQTDGSVDDAIVVASDPETIFDDAALTAISKWKFKEKIVNGVAVPQRALQKLQFKLEK